MNDRPDSESVETVRAFAIAQAAEAADLRIEVRRLKRDNVRLLRRLNKVYTSWTWRAGRIVLFPYYGIAWLIDRVRKRIESR